MFSICCVARRDRRGSPQKGISPLLASVQGAWRGLQCAAIRRPVPGSKASRERQEAHPVAGSVSVRLSPG